MPLLQATSSPKRRTPNPHHTNQRAMFKRNLAAKLRMLEFGTFIGSRARYVHSLGTGCAR
jgi:hypothetical protein